MANSFVLYMWMNAQCVCEKNSHKFNSQLDRFLNRKIKCCPWWHQGKAPIIELYNNPSSPLISPFLSPLLLSLLLFLPLFFSSFSPYFHSPCHPSPTSPLKLQTCSLLGSDLLPSTETDSKLMLSERPGFLCIVSRDSGVRTTQSVNFHHSLKLLLLFQNVRHRIAPESYPSGEFLKSLNQCHTPEASRPAAFCPSRVSFGNCW